MSVRGENRPAEVITPLGPDRLLLRRMQGYEEIGRPFEYHLDLLSKEGELVLENVLGRGVAVRLTLHNDEPRYFHGVCTRFEQVGLEGDYHLYRATLRPWLWLLTRTRDCRIFPDVNAQPDPHPTEMTAPEIVLTVFRELGFTSFENKLQKSDYPKFEFCVQYRETAFDFVHRLMEQAGFGYYFVHEEDKHTLVLSDDYDSYAKFPGYESVEYQPEADKQLRESDVFDQWSVGKEIRTGRVTLNDFNFTMPRSKLYAPSGVPRGHEHATLEAYDYPGRYQQIEDEGDFYSLVRAQSLATGFEEAIGGGNVRGVAAGHLMEVEGHPRGDQNKEYLLRRTELLLELNGYDTGKDVEADFQASAFVVDASEPYRLALITPLPRVEGPQTATVVGPSGEKVWTDQHGRVRCQFHWDRSGVDDENSSCWVRVSQSWAGSQWGSQHLPHIGHEVIVEFLEGDPDRPIITGRVYNGKNMPLGGLPADRFKSGFRDDYGNELIFDATEGDEHIRLYSPHRTSLLELGRSINQTTTSDSNTTTIGNTNSSLYGNKTISTYGHAHSNHFGTKSGVFAGFDVGVWVGGAFSVTVGIKAGLTLASTIDFAGGSKYSFFKGKQAEWGSEDFTKSVNKDIVLDANSEFQAVGGGHDNSILQMDDKQIVLELGKADSKSLVDQPMKAAVLYGATNLAALGAMVAVGLATDSVTAEMGKEKAKEDGSSQLSDAQIELLTQAFEDAKAANPNAQAEANDARAQANVAEAELEGLQADLTSAEADRDAKAATLTTLQNQTPAASAQELTAAQNEVTAAEQAVAAAQADVTTKQTDFNTLDADATAKETIWNDIEEKRARAQQAQAFATANEGHDWATTGIAIGAGTLSAIALVGFLVAAIKKRRAANADDDEPESRLTSRDFSTARVSLMEKGLFLEMWAKEKTPVASIVLDAKGNIRVKAKGTFEVDAAKGVNLNSNKVVQLRSTKEVVLGTPKVTQKAKSTIAPGPLGPPPVPPRKSY